MLHQRNSSNANIKEAEAILLSIEKSIESWMILQKIIED
jgi:hypothetical protein